MAVRGISRNEPICDERFIASQAMIILSSDVQRHEPLFGTGSPEGLYPATVGRQYTNIAGGVGTTQYVKRLPDIGGDKSMGWTLI